MQVDAAVSRQCQQPFLEDDRRRERDNQIEIERLEGGQQLCRMQFGGRNAGDREMVRQLLHRHALTRPSSTPDGPADHCREPLTVQLRKQPEALPHAEALEEIATLVGERSLDVEDDDGLERDARQTRQFGNVFRNDGRIGLRDDGDVHG